MAVPLKQRLRSALIAIGKEDTGTGGLVELHDNRAEPLVRWGFPGHEDRVVTAFYFADAPPTNETPNGLAITCEYSIKVPREQAYDGREEVIADRLREVMTHTALLAKGVDCRVRQVSRADAVDLGGEAITLPVRHRIDARE